MHRLLAALAVGGLLVLTAPPVAAQTDPRACFAQANQAAWGALTQGYNYSPAGYGPFGWAPLAQAFDPALAGAPPLYGAPPLPLPAYGPLGPGLTSTAIMAGAIPSAGFGVNGLDNSTLLDLQSLQQHELGTLNARYGVGASYQLAGSLWSLGQTYEARAIRQIGRALCAGEALRAAGAAATAAQTAAAAPTQPAPPSGGAQP
jgi:hypothetical protein